MFILHKLVFQAFPLQRLITDPDTSTSYFLTKLFISYGGEIGEASWLGRTDFLNLCSLPGLPPFKWGTAETLGFTPYREKFQKE